MSSHLSFALQEPSQVGEARRAAARLAEELGFNDTCSGRLALVVTELGTNLVRHAQGGRLLMAALRDSDGDPSCVELLAMDNGPGMADVNGCLRDGFSTGGTPGTGLGAIQRLSDEFSITSTPGRGTIVVARVLAAPAPATGRRFRASGLSFAVKGETVCGDAYAVQSSGDHARVIVADGLGHGPGAAEAAQAALRVFDASAALTSPAQVLERAHGALRITRGAAVAMVHLDAARGTLLFAGAGNIAGRIVSGVQDRSLMSQHGTIGLQIRRLQDLPYDWPEHSLLILHSDGLATRWTLDDTPGLLQCDPLVIAAWLVREHSRGRDDVTVVVIRRR